MLAEGFFYWATMALAAGETHSESLLFWRHSPRRDVVNLMQIRECVERFTVTDTAFCSMILESVPGLHGREMIERFASGGPESDADRRLIEAVGRALRATGYPAMRDVAIEVRHSTVIL